MSRVYSLRCLPLPLRLIAAVGFACAAWVTLPARAAAPAAVGQALVDLASQSYAEGSQSLRIGGEARLYYRVGPESPWQFEGDLRAFQETGAGRDQSFDVIEGKAVRESGQTSFWLGRGLPWLESNSSRPADLSEVRSARRRWAWLSARGQSWVQNQSEVFEPIPTGWVGAGVRHRWSEHSEFSLAASPVFLPHFGPSLRLSADQPAEASRYGRLPPQQVRIGEALFPLRYQVDTGELSKLLLQPQIYAEWRSGSFSLMGWSAPNPEPAIDPSAELLVREDDSRVLVTARPRFLRQDFLGMGWNSKFLNLEFLHELRSNASLASWSFEPLSGLEVGGLHRLGPGAASANAAERDALFARWRRRQGAWRPWLEWRGHPTLRESANAGGARWQDFSFRTGLETRLFRGGAWGTVSGYASAQLLAAEDEAPWASWRSLDFVQVGVVSRW